MRRIDQLLEDEELLATVHEALLKRHAQSQTRGRQGYPAEVVERILLLKHIRNWRFAILEREVRTNLLFTRVGGGKVPDAKTMGRLARALGPEVLDQIHQRVVAIAQQEQVITGRKMRVDTTVVEANIHSSSSRASRRWKLPLPEPAVALQPFGGLRERLGLEPAGPPLRVAAARNQAGALQDLHVLGDRRVTHRERRGQHNRFQ
jgi:hypothetical protein